MLYKLSKIKRDVATEVLRSLAQNAYDFSINTRKKYFDVASIHSIKKEKKSLSELSYLRRAILDLSSYYKKMRSSIETSHSISDCLDVSLPEREFSIGGIHIISYSIQRIRKICHSLGMIEAHGPEIELELYNFRALNIPKGHPARQSQDTFYVKNNNDRLLRTHTSGIQTRYMIKNNPPAKVFSLGKVYRKDCDSSHSPMFHQLEVLLVDSKTNMSIMQNYIYNFLRLFFSPDTLKIRFRSSYFPFTDPSFEIDIKDVKGRWLEIMGCGLISNQVLDNVGINKLSYNGFAFGVGIERLVMIKYGIQDIHNLYDSNINWQKYYSLFHN